MSKVSWILTRIAAAVAGAILVGVLAAAILTANYMLTCGPTCATIEFNGSGGSKCLAYGSTCGSFVGALLFYLIWAPIFSVAIGTLPGIVALTISPAKRHPWKSLPLLVVGTLVGFAIWLIVILHFKSESWGASGLITLLVFPTATGLLFAWNWERLPTRFRLRV